MPSANTCWLLLIVAGLFETGWAIGLKSTDGFTRFWPSVWTAVALVVSMVLLAVAVRGIPIGTAYAVWVGIGAAGTAILGVLLFQERVTLGKSLFLILLLIAIVGLKWSSGDANSATEAQQLSEDQG